ncbi:1500_t:CDS:2, partial [Gigaspora rosea]
YYNVDKDKDKNIGKIDNWDDYIEERIVKLVCIKKTTESIEVNMYHFIDIQNKKNLPIATWSEKCKNCEFESRSSNRTCRKENLDMVVIEAPLNIAVQNVLEYNEVYNKGDKTDDMDDDKKEIHKAKIKHVKDTKIFIKPKMKSANIEKEYIPVVSEVIDSIENKKKSIKIEKDNNYEDKAFDSKAKIVNIKVENIEEIHNENMKTTFTSINEGFRANDHIYYYKDREDISGASDENAMIKRIKGSNEIYNEDNERITKKIM